MDTLQQHEVFEIEVLDQLHRTRALAPLVFGGGTMLRLCHELNRYSADLDLWFIRGVAENDYFDKVKRVLETAYELTDACIKHYTMLFELRSSIYPKRLKIEIRRKISEMSYHEKIAFSRFSNRQVLVKAFTLEHCMINKVNAFLDRGEIRDCFDIEFLLRRGIQLPHLETTVIKKFDRKLKNLKQIDYKVKLGSIIESDLRKYYIDQGFAFLKEKLHIAFSGSTAGD